jgi:Tol biopolymer transport system component
MAAALTSGSRLGSYEIVAPLEAGGMGEVYRARDTKLNRDVAVKILSQAFVNDPDRLVRFRREAQVLAALNHPHIAHIHGMEESGGLQALIMEFVEGDDLAQRLARGPMPVDDVLPIARQIADAIESAHDQNIIHRDLKPANIKVRPDGTVKVLDFGLARTMESFEAVSPNVTASPTLTNPGLTQAGIILGTAAYMSPEQAKGRPADKRCDMWAFGCVLYEMLTGKRAYPGDDVSDTLAAILRAEPDWSALPAATPDAIRRLLRRCLSKDRKARLADASAARLEIDEALGSSAVAPRRLEAISHRRIHLMWASAVAALLAAAGAVLFWAARPPAVPPVMRLEITTPPTTDTGALAISPDGRHIVFAARVEGRSQLWLRPLDSTVARPLAGTAGGVRPFWSPDSRSIGFFNDGRLKRLEIDGGSPGVLATAGLGMGGAWLPDGSILFSSTALSPIVRLPATGGDPAPVTRLAAQQIAHRFPHLLPDGRHFLYTAIGAAAAAGIYLGQIDTSETKRLLDADVAVYAASGYVFFVRQSTLYAQPFDLRRFELTGTPTLVAEQLPSGNLIPAALSVSTAGHLVYRTGPAAQRQLVWFDRSGTEVGQVGASDTATPRAPAMSPDGRRIALTRVDGTGSDIWLLDATKGLPQRFTTGERGGYAIWSPDGEHIAFTSLKGSDSFIYIKPVNRTGNSEPLFTAPGYSNPMDWSRDGQFLLFRHYDPGKSNDVWAMPMRGERKAFPVVQSDFDERDAQFSPNGKWIAYQSDESSQFEIYIQRFPVAAGKERVSTNGGAQVRWRADGKELFYVGLDDRLMAVPVAASANGERLEVGSPVPLFATRIGGAVEGVARQQYVVSPDGQRFLMNTIPEQAASPISVLLNWNQKH